MPKNKKKERVKKLPKVRLTFSFRQWEVIQDIAAANNLTEAAIVKKAALTHIDSILIKAREIMQKNEAQSTESNSGDDESQKEEQDGRRDDVDDTSRDSTEPA